MLHDDATQKYHAAAYGDDLDDTSGFRELDALDDEEEEELSSVGDLSPDAHAEEAEIYAPPSTPVAPYEPPTRLSTPPVAAPAPVVKAPAKKKAAKKAPAKKKAVKKPAKKAA